MMIILWSNIIQVSNIYICIYVYRKQYSQFMIYCTVTTFKYVEGGPDREAPEVVWITSSYI